MARFAFTEKFLAGSASLALACTTLAAMGAAAQSQTSIPDFSSNGTSWQTNNGGEFIAVPGSPAPVRQDPAHPFVPNGQGKQPTYRIADLTDPNLKQWAKDVMKKFAKDNKIKSCNQCHAKLAPKYELKDDAFTQFQKLGGK